MPVDSRSSLSQKIAIASPSPAAPPLLAHGLEQTEPIGGRKEEMAAAAAGEETVRASYKGSRVISVTTRADVAVHLGKLRDQILAGRTSFADLAVLRDQILAGRASFTDLAVQHSDCSSARRGGDLRCYYLPQV